PWPPRLVRGQGGQSDPGPGSCRLCAACPAGRGARGVRLFKEGATPYNPARFFLALVWAKGLTHHARAAVRSLRRVYAALADVRLPRAPPQSARQRQGETSREPRQERAAPGAGGPLLPRLAVRLPCRFRAEARPANL